MCDSDSVLVLLACNSGRLSHTSTKLSESNVLFVVVNVVFMFIRRRQRVTRVGPISGVFRAVSACRTRI